ncbi:MAG TPA: preprotein translocase subunit SecY [Candidatus Thermoplasmatota archaeon]|nr:preprotein translocase subunit SecY [Candidatus Thermoplasmatota archaeon]
MPLVEERKSLLYKLEPISKRWPAVTKPEGHVHFRSKLMWSLGSLLVYFVLANVFIYGLSPTNIDAFAGFRAILAGASGSLVHLGIGPIVTGSIIMQLFAGAKIIKLDLTKPEDKAVYQGVQKLLVLVMIFVESIPQVFGFLPPDANFVAKINTYEGPLASFFVGNGDAWAKTAIVAQLAVGSYLVFLMDEVVSKWGLGSGISLFIAAGVSQALFTGLVNWIPQSEGAWSIANPPTGVLPKTFYLLNEFSTAQLIGGGGFERILLAPPNPIIALVATIITFMIVVYVESSRVELPLAHGKVRGARGRYPIRLLYASNIPVILAGALLANVNLIGLLLWHGGPLQNLPFIGKQEWVGGYQPGTTTAISGIAYYLSVPAGVQDWLLPFLSPQYGGVLLYRESWQIILHILMYAAFMIGGSILFAVFWIETTNMGPEKVASQIEKSGMQIPGFRRDPRVTGKILERYIPVVTVIGGAAIGALAVFADLLGTVGNAGGTGVLLTVGIFQRLYEQIAKEQAMEMHPVLRGFFGER